MTLVEEIGTRLDDGLEVQVGNGGVVMFSDDSDFSLAFGKERFNAAERSKRSSTKPWEGASGRKRATEKPWSTSPYDTFSGPEQGVALSAPDEITSAYPGAVLWREKHGFWLLVESQILAGEHRHARIAMAVSLCDQKVRAWAFWVGPVIQPTPIGPRHTYLDGAICAFHVLDNAWSFGEPLVNLLDLYTIWVFRHLHLERFGYWPGFQLGTLAFERIVEFHPNEHCGCLDPKGRYNECCAINDLSCDRVKAFAAYEAFFGPRRPPPSVFEFATKGASPPLMDNYLQWAPGQ